MVCLQYLRKRRQTRTHTYTHLDISRVEDVAAGHTPVSDILGLSNNFGRRGFAVRSTPIDLSRGKGGGISIGLVTNALCWRLDRAYSSKEREASAGLAGVL